MPFFDVVDDVARHQIEKTAMGDNRIMGALVCTVTKNYDKEKQASLCSRRRKGGEAGVI